VPEPEKFVREPPETVMSDLVKFEEDSEREKVSVVVSPAASEERSELIAMDGAAESLMELTVACVAELPAKSLTSAVMVRVPSAREERSRPVTE